MYERKRCTQVHNSLYIDARGDVFACCHAKPGVVGNIYTNTLEEIYSSDRLKEFRRREIAGTLHCLKSCHLPQAGSPSDSLEHDYHTDLKQLKILFGERCNVKCIMCSQEHASKLELDPETLVRNVEIPRSCDYIVFQGGETLILKSAKAFFDHCAAHDKKVSLITNGTAIGEEMAKKIALHCLGIVFSLNASSKEIHEIVNAGSKFEKVLRNIRRVVDAKRRFKGGVRIIGHMTIVPENIHEIPEFIRKKDEFGFERINFGFDTGVPHLLAQNPVMKGELSSAIKAEIAKASKPNRIGTARLHMLDLV
jgi:radical SAM protein with 4Fe4S-binding SPASM domain